jgi:hypothetical protein
MKSKKAGFGAVASAIIALTAVIVIAMITVGPDGSLATTTGTLNEKSDAFFDMIDENNELSRNIMNADPVIVETWNQLVTELEYVKQNELEDYCVIPFQRGFFSERNNIEFLQNDEDLLLKIGYSMDDTQTGAPMFETYPLENMNLYYGEVICPNGETLEEGISYCPSLQYGDVPVFGPIEVTKVETLETDVVGVLLDNVHTTSIHSDTEQSPFTFQPLYAFQAGYEAAVSTQPSTARADILADGTSGIILANNENVVFMLVNLDAIEGSGISSPNSAYTNLLIDFNDESGIEGNSQGYAFCNPVNNELLIPKSGDLSQCSCQVAQNERMCRSLLVENCGVDCAWEDERCIVDPDNRRNFFRSMLDIGDTILEDNDKHHSCVAYYPLTLTHDVPALENEDGTLDETNLYKYVNNLVLQFGITQLSVFDETDISSLLSVEYENGRRDELDITVDGETTQWRGPSFMYSRESLVLEDEAHIEKINGYYGFFVEHGQNSLNFLSTDEVERRFRDKTENIIFCDMNTPYMTNLIDTDAGCDDIRNVDSCLLHSLTQEEGRSCYWRRARASLLANILTVGTASLGNNNDCERTIRDPGYEDVIDFFNRKESGCLQWDWDELDEIVLTNIGDDAHLSLLSNRPDQVIGSGGYGWYFLDYFEDTTFMLNSEIIGQGVLTTESYIEFSEQNGKTKIFITDNCNR